MLTMPVGGGGGGCSFPMILSFFQVAIFGQQYIQVINNIRRNHLIFGQALQKIFGQQTSAPNQTVPCVYVFMHT